MIKGGRAPRWNLASKTVFSRFRSSRLSHIFSHFQYFKLEDSKPCGSCTSIISIAWVSLMESVDSKMNFTFPFLLFQSGKFVVLIVFFPAVVIVSILISFCRNYGVIKDLLSIVVVAIVPYNTVVVDSVILQDSIFFVSFVLQTNCLRRWCCGCRHHHRGHKRCISLFSTGFPSKRDTKSIVVAVDVFFVVVNGIFAAQLMLERFLLYHRHLRSHWRCACRFCRWNIWNHCCSRLCSLSSAFHVDGMASMTFVVVSMSISNAFVVFVDVIAFCGFLLQGTLYCCWWVQPVYKSCLGLGRSVKSHLQRGSERSVSQCSVAQRVLLSIAWCCTMRSITQRVLSLNACNQISL